MPDPEPAAVAKSVGPSGRPTGAPAGAPAGRLQARGLRSELSGPFDVELGAGRALAITGASGSGKSLFLRLLADLDPGQGEVRLDGAPRSAFSGPAWRRRVPYVAAESGWWLPVVEAHFEPPLREAARALADRLDVRTGAFADEVRLLSTGEKQRLALVRALVLDSPVLLLDEPTGALDPESTARVEAVLRERLQAGTTLVFVSHDPAQPGRMGAEHRVMRHRRLEPAP